MRERGLVVAVHEDEVDLRMSPSGDCDNCGMCSGTAGERIMEGVENRVGASIGDLVDIEIDSASHLRAVVQLYLVPVTMLAVGYLAGFLLASWLGFDPDTVGAVTALLSATITLRLLRRTGKGAQGHAEKPRVHAIIARGCDGCDSGL